MCFFISTILLLREEENDNPGKINEYRINKHYKINETV